MFSFENEKQSYIDIFTNVPKCFYLIVIGLDLTYERSIHNFFFLNKGNMTNFNNNLFIYSLDNSEPNLNSITERKKDIIKSKLNIYISEKASKHHANKYLIYSEVCNFTKLTKDIAIIEYVINKEINKLPVEYYEFEKINIYMKEYKDIFEAKTEEKEEALPTSTFKLTLNEKELQAKNEVVLPYMKAQNKDNIITIDQEDLNELYEEDPDGDLDI